MRRRDKLSSESQADDHKKTRTCRIFFLYLFIFLPHLTQTGTPAWCHFLQLPVQSTLQMRRFFLYVQYEIPVFIQCHKQFSYFGGDNISLRPLHYFFFFSKLCNFTNSTEQELLHSGFTILLHKPYTSFSLPDLSPGILPGLCAVRPAAAPTGKRAISQAAWEMWSWQTPSSGFGVGSQTHDNAWSTAASLPCTRYIPVRESVQRKRMK